MSSLSLSTHRPASHPVEIVERKGIGHPDTMCDALAEELSRAYSQYCLERFGLVLHHNVDKALLCGGSSEPRFGGGRVTAPIDLYFAGRATCEMKGSRIPIAELMQESASNWLHKHFHALLPEQHVRLHCLIRPGSAELVDLYLRQEQTGIALANDTSCGAGYAPLSELERMVLQVEKHLNTAALKLQYPEIGEDIKVMGVRREDAIDLTIACAFIDRYIADTDDYVAKKNQVVKLAEQAIEGISNKTVTVSVNTADDIASGSLYLTVIGTSAEAGDDGEVGRGNRVNGLIAPYRPMNMEAAAGKNPITHVGKLYNIVAQRIAGSLVEELDEVSEASCYLVSRIGSPIHEPQLIDLQLATKDGQITIETRRRIEDMVQAQLERIYLIREEILAGTLLVY